MHPNDKRGSYNGGHGHSGRWGNTNGRNFSERGDGHHQQQQHQRNRWNHDNPQQYQRYGDHNRDNHHHNNRYDDRRRDDNRHQSSSSSQDGRNFNRHDTSTSYGPKNGNGRDQQDRGGGDERKRPASSLPTETAAVVNTTIHQKRAKSDESSTTTDPTEQSNNKVEPTKISATAAPTAISTAISVSKNDDEGTYQAQLDANKAAYVECLREVDQELFHVSNQAHEVPRPGWDEMKQNAVENTLKELEHIKRQDYNDNEEYYSSDESLPPGCSGSPKKPSTGLTQGEIRFIKALPHCLPLNAGFHVLQVQGSRICYCPCGPNLGPWRSKHKIFCDRVVCKKSFGKTLLSRFIECVFLYLIQCKSSYHSIVLAIVSYQHMILHTKLRPQ